MSSYLFLPAPAHGHVNPTLAIAAELVARGNRVTYFLPDRFRPAVESTGAGLRDFAVEPLTPPDNAEGDVAATLGYVADRMLAFAEVAAEPLQKLFDELRPDVVLSEKMAFWATFLVLGRRANGVDFSPSYLLPAIGGAGALPGAIDGTRLTAVAARYGVAEPDPAALLGDTARSTIVFMHRDFHPPLDVDDSVHFVGPVATRPERDPGFPVDELHDAVFVSLGTAFNRRRAFFADCIEAFRGAPEQVVLNHGDGVDPVELPAAPANFVLAPHVPQLAVLRRSRVFVTHGGMNSTMEAIAAGVPMVVVPQMAEQAMTAERVARLGLGVRLDPVDVTPARLASAVRFVADDPGIRSNLRKARELAYQAGGGVRAADLLEEAAR
ncbi:nucleotide disphospho-sugar-binding domain-containing protein [Amycolatopsis sp. NPDC004378]